MKTWTPNAEKYDFGRPFPGRHVVALFKRYAENQNGQGKTVFEPGSGTGRILIPLADSFRNWSFVGMDSSRDCLNVARARASAEKLNNIELLQGIIEKDLPDLHCDLVLHSSVLHVVPKWCDAMKSLSAMLSENGLFCLVGDYGDLYAAALGRNDRDGLDHDLAKFWRRYIELRLEVGAPNPESTQVGCKWDLQSSELARWLEQNGFHEVMTEETNWTETLSLSDLIEIVEERCYSSMFTLDDSMVNVIVDGLKKSFEADWATWNSTSRHQAICRFFARRK